jgi:hypothetical protein
MAANFMRSTSEPTTRAAVMAAKVAWNEMKVSSGITTPVENVATLLAGVTSLRNRRPRPPTKLSQLPPSVNAKL